MKRKLWMANVVLVALCAAGGWRLRREWLDDHAREQAVLQKTIPPVPAPPAPSPAPPEQVKAMGYSEIAQKMLFSKDRNPIVVVEAPPPPKPKPMPPLPLFHGTVDLGDGPMAIMSEGPKAPHRDYQPGDKVGEFKLVAVNDEELTLEWEGKTITKKVDEMLDHTAAAPAPQASAVSGKPQNLGPPVATAPAEPGGELPGGIRACQPGDTSPPGTVSGGMRKVSRSTPFGSRCYWESDKGDSSDKNDKNAK